MEGNTGARNALVRYFPGRTHDGLSYFFPPVHILTVGGAGTVKAIFRRDQIAKNLAIYNSAESSIKRRQTATE